MKELIGLIIMFAVTMLAMAASVCWKGFGDAPSKSPVNSPPVAPKVKLAPLSMEDLLLDHMTTERAIPGNLWIAGRYFRSHPCT